METQQKTLEERKMILAQYVQQAVARGARVESQSDTMAVVIFGNPVNHVFHLLLGLFTFGLWWIVWLYLAINGGERRQIIIVDDFGNAHVRFIGETTGSMESVSVVYGKLYKVLLNREDSLKLILELRKAFDSLQCTDTIVKGLQSKVGIIRVGWECTGIALDMVNEILKKYGKRIEIK